ncbi:protein-arginine deiminase domain-containing protein [Aspergillus alliaceus]|uniref:protein-arginine deiminase domain-containing protein n=1 Tax=Petromyces alliaceus TaxID=209559 RepID=UPI0012A46997|nr:uncharacterized protein BDW43DRAFT_322610 [Aspergillus alliaceus]KAB8237193.1 hypothetical protein BDW43DRAFT_322610 [Aspergillus alliaceus]
MKDLAFIIRLAALCNCCRALKADIRADSNRDGGIDIHGWSDYDHKLEWSNTAGAVFLANIGDTDRRCSRAAQQWPPLSDEALAACNDASDDIQRSPQYMAPLKTLPLKGLSPQAYATIRVNEEIARKNVRIFRRDGWNWLFTTNDYRFSQKQLEQGLELGIDARDTRRPGGWDGRVEVHFHVQNETDSSDDYVRLRVAPVITYNHLQAVKEFLTLSGKDREHVPYQEQFVSGFRKALQDTGVDRPLYLFNGSDPWIQDILEPAYTSMPGPEGRPVTLEVMIRSSQGSRVAGRQVFEYLRGTGRGAVYSTGGTRDEVDSMGNLETIPPYGDYPAGRIIEGHHGKLKPHIYQYMRAQEIQDPLILDADWLGVGHVDEFVQFLPYKNNLRGWVLFIADPIGGIKILEDAAKNGYGDTKAFSRSNATPPPPEPPDPYVPGYTIKELLTKPKFIKDNYRFADHITEVLKVLQKETGLRNQDIYRVPSVFETGVCWGYDEGHAAALYPGVINGLVLSDSQYLSPNPWGPLINKIDIMAEATRQVYGKVGYNVTFIDNWYSHHRDGGEVHCGSNSIRVATKPWWKKGLASFVPFEVQQ